MRIHVDLASLVAGTPRLIQVEKAPEPFTGQPGQQTPINGKFVVPLPSGLDVPVGQGSYILDGTGDVDGGDILSQSFGQILALYPAFQYIYYNPLLTPAHVGELDPTKPWKDEALVPPRLFSARYQTGRSAGPEPLGQMPTHTAVLAQNNTTTPPRPGVLVTQNINLTPFAPGPTDPGFREFMVYWRLLDFETTQDVANSAQNEPAIRYLREIEQEPDGFEVYISPDDGDHWCRVHLLQPIGLTNTTKELRVAFVNRGSAKRFIANFAFMF